MKRLMIAGIAGLCAAVSFGLESANVVGYNKAEMTAGENIYRVATFEGVNSSEGATFTIGQISVGTEDFAWYNGDYIATVDAYGSQEQYYTWDPDANEGAGGWFACDEYVAVDPDSPADAVALPLNKGVIVYSANGANLTFSGAVMSGDTELYGISGENTYTGNFTPATLTLGDIVVGAEDFAWYNGDYIATIDLYGSQELYYTWDPDANEGAGGWFACDEYCAVDTDSPANSVSFEPNMGFLFYTANGAVLNIPSPIN